MVERAALSTNIEDDEVDTVPRDPRSNLVPFQKGERRVGRKKGRPNKITRIIKEAVLLAAEQCGEPTFIPPKKKGGKGQWVWNGADGLVGYLRYLAKVHPASYTVLLAKVLPLQIAAKVEEDYSYESVEDVAEAMRRKGLGHLVDRVSLLFDCPV
jgi:hypothetical protein